MKLILKSKKNLHYATAEWDGGRITILAGSKINLALTYPKMSEDAKQARENAELVDTNGILLKDVQFNSVSTAAQFVTGRSSNGYIAWRPDDKMSLKEYLNK